MAGSFFAVFQAKFGGVVVMTSRLFGIINLCRCEVIAKTLSHGRHSRCGVQQRKGMRLDNGNFSNTTHLLPKSRTHNPPTHR